MKKKFLPTILKSAIEDVYLFYINIKNAFYNFFLFLQEIFKYYTNPALRNIDFELFRIYAIKDQFQVSMEESKQFTSFDADNFTYGEAIWKSINKIMDFVKPGKTDIFYDLGCGTGRVCFFVNEFYSIETHGVDLIPSFIKNADQIVKKFNLKHIYFHETDWNKLDISKADIIYIAGTCLDESSLDTLTEKFKTLKSGSKIISVSNPFQKDNIVLIKEMKLPFSWGKANVYISELK